MKIADAVAGVQRLCVDTAPFIYFIEGDSVYIDRMREIIRRADADHIEIVTSVITLSEVLTKPLKESNALLEKEYRDFLLKTRHVEIVEITIAIANQAAHLRAKYDLITPDALQIATALSTGCEGFLTNNRGLLRVTEIKVLLLDDLDNP